jgi:hypothetical protein
LASLPGCWCSHRDARRERSCSRGGGRSFDRTARAVPPCIQTGTLEIAGEPKIVSLDSSAGTTASNSVPSRSYGGAPRRDSSRRSLLKFLVGEPGAPAGSAMTPQRRRLRRERRLLAPGAMPSHRESSRWRPDVEGVARQYDHDLRVRFVDGDGEKIRLGVPGWVRDPDGCVRPLRHAVGLIGRGPVPQARASKIRSLRLLAL